MGIIIAGELIISLIGAVVGVTIDARRWRKRHGLPLDKEKQLPTVGISGNAGTPRAVYFQAGKDIAEQIQKQKSQAAKA